MSTASFFMIVQLESPSSGQDCAKLSSSPLLKALYTGISFSLWSKI